MIILGDLFLPLQFGGGEDMSPEISRNCFSLPLILILLHSLPLITGESEGPMMAVDSSPYPSVQFLNHPSLIDSSGVGFHPPLVFFIHFFHPHTVVSLLPRRGGSVKETPLLFWTSSLAIAGVVVVVGFFFCKIFSSCSQESVVLLESVSIESFSPLCVFF
jgi:hypothetical protein